MKEKTSLKVADIIKELRERGQAIEHIMDESYKHADKMLLIDADTVNHLKISLTSLQLYSNQLYMYGTPCDYITKINLIEEKLTKNNPNDFNIVLQELDTSEAEESRQELLVNYRTICLIIVVYVFF